MRKYLRYYIKLVCCVIGLVGAVGGAEAGGVRYPCNSPLVFEGADINNYIGAFDGISGSVTHLDAVGAELSLLIQFDALYSQVGLGSIGAIQLVPDIGDHVCDDESIMDMLLGKLDGARGEVKDGSGIILISGRFENMGDDVYIVSRVGFVRKGTKEMVLIRDRSGVDSLALVGVLPRNEVTFSPRRIDSKQLGDITEAYDRYIRVRRERSMSDEGVRIDAQKSSSAAFAIQGISDGWLEIDWYGEGGVGYVKVPEHVGQLGLRELMPELFFMEAAAVYLSLMVRGSDISDHVYKRRVRRFDRLSEMFARFAGGRSDEEALSLLDAMSGFLRLTRAKTEADITAAADRFSSAARQMPANSNALMLDILGQHARNAWRSDHEPHTLEAADALVVRKLVNLIDMDPGNATAKLNFVTKMKQYPALQSPNNVKLREFIDKDKSLINDRSAVDRVKSRGNR